MLLGERSVLPDRMPIPGKGRRVALTLQFSVPGQDPLTPSLVALNSLNLEFYRSNWIR